MLSFSPKRYMQIIIVCMTSHNFIRNSELRDEEFNKCDDNKDYMPNNEDDNVRQEVIEPYEDDFPESENEVFMNTIHDNIVNSFISGE
jgi:hypothetical protein